MADAGAQERTEQATPKKRQDARKKGTVAKSSDLTSSVAMLAALLILPGALKTLFSGGEQSITAGLSNIPVTVTNADIARQFVSCIVPNLKGLAMLLAALALVGLAVSVGQVGFLLSGEALKPQWNRLNPMEGLKRLFSRNASFEALKALLKSGLIALLAYLAIMSAVPKLMAIGFMPIEGGVQVATESIRTMALRVVFAWLALAGLDYFFQRKRVERELKMSKQEVKQEMKEFEQNPEVRMAQARRRRQLARKSLQRAVQSADVILTNPTHYAVAIEYDSSNSTAPIVVAKGADLLAARIRELATENEVPIVPNPPLTRALYHKCEVGDAIPKEFFQPVAEVLAYVYKTLNRLRKNGQKTAPNSK